MSAPLWSDGDRKLQLALSQESSTCQMGVSPVSQNIKRENYKNVERNAVKGLFGYFGPQRCLTDKERGQRKVYATETR